MAFLKAFGAWLPQRVVTNEEAGSWVGSAPAWIRSVSGIEERRFATEKTSVAEMAALAGMDCLERAGVDASSLGMVIVSSGSGTRQFPGPASDAAKRLGAAGIPALDLPLASAGTLFALSMASRLAETVGRILVIGAEKMSDVINREPQEKGVAILFGDGAGACLVDPAEGAAKIVDSVLGSDGNYCEDLCLSWDKPLSMNGRSVILQASRKIPAAINAVLDRNQVRHADVDAFLMHQANQNLIVRVAEAVGVPTEKFFSNISRYGNTSSASLLIAAKEWVEEHGWHTGQPVVFAAFGAGYHWGSLLAVGE
jgi:3-oxoacyl-[acyl-carrier-protein] synthase-3